MNKKTGFSETIILPKIQPKNILPNANVCPAIQEQHISNNLMKSKSKSKFYIPSQFPKITNIIN